MRDIVFMFKAMMTPTSDSLPELRRWRPRDAALWWKYKPGEGFDVNGFNRKLEVLAWKEGDAGDKGTGWLSCLLYTSPSPRDRTRSRMPSSA